MIIEKKSFGFRVSFSFSHSEKQLEIDNMPMKHPHSDTPSETLALIPPNSEP